MNLKQKSAFHDYGSWASCLVQTLGFAQGKAVKAANAEKFCNLWLEEPNEDWKKKFLSSKDGKRQFKIAVTSISSPHHMAPGRAAMEWIQHRAGTTSPVHEDGTYFAGSVDGIFMLMTNRKLEAFINEVDEDEDVFRWYIKKGEITLPTEYEIELMHQYKKYRRQKDA